MARFGSWGSLIAACAMVMACAPASEGFGDGSATQLGGDDSTGDGGMTSMQSADGPTSAAEGNGSGGGSEGDSTGAGEGDGPEPMAEEEELGRANFGGCNQPLWCYAGGNINNPAGGAIWAQECFRADMEPPFELVEVEAVIRGMSPELFNIELQVYERSGSGGPMSQQPLATRMIPREDLSIGVNTITLESPIELDRQRFCIGLAAPDEGLFGSLGVSVDPGSQVDDVSYFRIEGNGGCWLPQWTDVIDDEPNPSGNWCIRGTVREL